MAIRKKDRIRAKRRTQRVRSNLKRLGMVPRVTVFRSLKHMYVQVVDDMKQQTLASCSTLELKDLKGNKKEKAYAIGLELAKKAKEKGVNAIVFDRGRFRFHGRVKSLAQGLGEGGLKF